MEKNKVVPLNIPAVANGPATLGESATAGGAVSALDRWLARKLLEFVGDPPLRLVLWNGEEVTSSRVSPVARLVFRDKTAFYRLLRYPDLHFGDLYSTGRIEVDGDLVQSLETAYRGTAAARAGMLTKLQTFRNRPRANSLNESRDNIHHHYDIGNEFYELWLDREAMQYTCAYFPDPAMTLEQAQRAKMDHVCRKLRLKPGDRVVEAGCGWGGLARHMARHYGVNVRAYNISHEQILYARDTARAEGLEDRVEYIEDDYRNIGGEYDAFVSIGMLEHVGQTNYTVLGRVVDRCLAHSGRGLIHSIGRNQAELMNAWVEKRIFPGAYPPTLREMMDIFEPYNFSVLDVENLRLHYAKTLEHWLERFENQAARVEQAFDRHFVRAWRLYLAGSVAAFTTGSLQLFQIVFTRGANNDLPWSREHLYRET
jgi:cyclopropane-fatty-acyl-phospholipid synthase